MKIVTTPDPRLREVSTKVNKITDETKKIVDEMTKASLAWEKEHPYELSAAMAAPQLGFNKRIIIIREDMEDKKNNSQKLIPLVWIAQIFGHLATQNVLEINDEQLKLLMEKRDFNDERLKDYEWNFVILRWNGVGVWLVSVQKWIWKNKCF